ncbi:unnamed protein product [Trichogramma brassicae]|uniref:Uncharacterized protein n=1 Tax=Trichogramma brassicae TaxID=86971 RepID=A0A6H5IR53_9HYME|nr:unnamed protein product [Trichogramma brassicae]
MESYAALYGTLRTQRGLAQDPVWASDLCNTEICLDEFKSEVARITTTSVNSRNRKRMRGGINVPATSVNFRFPSLFHNGNPVKVFKLCEVHGLLKREQLERMIADLGIRDCNISGIRSSAHSTTARLTCFSLASACYVGRVSDNDDHRDSRTRSAVCVPVKCTSYIVRVSRWHREQQQCEHLLRDVQVIDETRRRSEDESRERLRRPLKRGADPRSVRRSYLATKKRCGSITRTRTECSAQRAVVGMASSDRVEEIAEASQRPAPTASASGQATSTARGTEESAVAVLTRPTQEHRPNEIARRQPEAASSSNAATDWIVNMRRLAASIAHLPSDIQSQVMMSAVEAPRRFQRNGQGKSPTALTPRKHSRSPYAKSREL